MRPAVIAFAALAAACSSEPRTLTIEVTTGHERDAFSKDPAVTEVRVAAIDAAGATIASAVSQPGGGFSLGELEADAFMRLEVTGVDASGAVRVRGRSVGVPLGDVASEVIPVFAQRLGELGRPPGELLRSHVGGRAAVLGERFLLVTGGSALGADGSETAGSAGTFYDLFSLGPAHGVEMPRSALSLATSADGEAVLVIDDDGASWVDFASGAVSEAALPDGLGSFGEVAGGRTIAGPDASYVVGATRTDAPSDGVLVVAADRTLTAVRLTAARRGAAATWVDGVGLVVAAGHATADGVETLAAGAGTFGARPFPPDPTEGAAAVATGSGDEVALAGGTIAGDPAPTRVIAASCAATCEPEVLAGDGLQVALERCQGYSLAPGQLAIACRSPEDGMTRLWALRLAGHTVAELVLREPRAGASVVATPLGTLAILGGVHPDGSPALTIETLFPE